MAEPVADRSQQRALHQFYNNVTWPTAITPLPPACSFRWTTIPIRRRRAAVQLRRGHRRSGREPVQRVDHAGHLRERHRQPQSLYALVTGRLSISGSAASTRHAAEWTEPGVPPRRAARRRSLPRISGAQSVADAELRPALGAHPRRTTTTTSTASPTSRHVRAVDGAVPAGPVERLRDPQIDLRPHPYKAD